MEVDEEEKKEAMPVQKASPKKRQNLGINVIISQSEVSRVYAWGDNRNNQLGIRTEQEIMTRPALFKQPLSIAKIECGADHTLCLTKEGRVYYWGQYYLNSKKGEKSKFGSTKEPRLMQSLLDHVIIDIACGTGHNLALSETKKMYTWGTGCLGELGIGPDNLGNF